MKVAKNPGKLAPKIKANISKKSPITRHEGADDSCRRRVFAVDNQRPTV